MIEIVICKRCQGAFSYERKFRPRIYCDTCRPIVYREHATAPYDPDYQKRYYRNVRKPRMAAMVASQDRGSAA